MLIVIVGSLVFFGYVSYIVQDTAFPSEHPWLFLTETAVVGFVPASVLYVISDFRDDGRLDMSSLNQEYLLLVAKFAVFHMLFQFSGLYTYLFLKTPNKR